MAWVMPRSLLNTLNSVKVPNRALNKSVLMSENAISSELRIEIKDFATMCEIGNLNYCKFIFVQLHFARQRERNRAQVFSHAQMNELWLWHILFLSFLQDYNDPCPYSLSPVTIKSQKLLRSPRKATRKISRIPFKVLDAPELQDDFYLNLVDWSAQNVLAVGLGSCVYLWSACTSQVSLTITQRTFYHLSLAATCETWAFMIHAYSEPFPLNHSR